MILAIAERVHDPRISDARVERWRNNWTGEHRLRCILSTPAMTVGTTRARLESMLGLRPNRVVNLLWPDNKIGTWDAFEAERSAMALVDWLDDTVFDVGPTYTGVVLLGSRVAKAYLGGVGSWGMVTVAFHLPTLVLPHPSGRNRLLNDETTRRRLRRAAKRFVTLSKA